MDLNQNALWSLSGSDFSGYGVFPDDEVDYSLAEDGSSTTLSAPDTAGASVSPPSALLAGSQKGKQRVERRGHTKSRRGCYNCKRRRIKCQESRPACGHCVKTGLKCEYPAVPQVTHQPQHQIPLFSLQDMRFFQHFLFKTVPHYPLGNESIWTHEVPCLSQNYEYLMHAILGLAASDLMSQDPSLVTFAMQHRLKAIKAIKKTLTDVPKGNTFEEGNALMATCFALTFQSVCLEDGMAEFMTFCRGIVIVAIQMYCKGTKLIFNNFIHEDSMAILKPLMELVPPLPRQWSDMAVTAIRALAPLCKHTVELEYHAILLEMAEALYTSPVTAYQMLCKHYGWWMQIPHESFARIVNPESQACVLLASHWISVKQIMVTVTEVETRAKRGEQYQHEDCEPDPGMTRWLKYLNKQVAPDHQGYNQWPLWVEARLNEDLKYFRNVG
jgi:hypothetical protein